MKKYLMIGFVAAVAFTSCSKNDFVTTTQADIDKAKYDQAFRNYIGGAPAANQDWGFGATITRAFTRASINVNGNQWKSCPTVGSSEDADVAAYVRALTTLPNTNPARLQNYYVTQIHTGTETYTDLDNHSGILGSEKMNNLHIAMQSTATLDKSTGKLSGDWEHINNFNAGKCTDWSAGVDGHGNTLVTGGGTFDFAYEGAEDSKYHNRWIAIDGANVPKTGGGNYAGNYYVCFDFEATNDKVQTAWRAKFWNPEGNNGGEWQEKDFVIDGAYTLAQLEELEYTVELWSVIDNKNKPYTYRLGDTSKVTNLRIDNYREGNKVVLGNDKYDDWIIRLVEAQPKNDDPNPNVLRIVAEDLTATQASDFDFNDVVLDVTLGNPATVTLVAAGGTLQLKVGSNGGNGGVEVHEALLGAANAKNGNVYKMVSPGGDVWQEGGYAVDITQYITDKDIQTPAAANTKIRIEVYKNGEWQLLTAPQGESACKLGVDQSYTILSERESIKTHYPDFVEWATLNTISKWW